MAVFLAVEFDICADLKEYCAQVVTDEGFTRSESFR
jgi:hypothetical protein